MDIDSLRELLDPKAYGGYELTGCADKDTYKDFIKEHIIDEVFVSYPEGPVRSEIIETLVDMGLTVHIDIGQYLDEMPNSHISNLNDRSVITTAINPMTFRQKFTATFVKTISDLNSHTHACSAGSTTSSATAGSTSSVSVPARRKNSNLRRRTRRWSVSEQITLTKCSHF